MCLKALYEKLWWGKDVNNEMLTPQFKRMAKAHPVVFWGIIGTICSGLLTGVGFMSWFILHLGV